MTKDRIALLVGGALLIAVALYATRRQGAASLTPDPATSSSAAAPVASASAAPPTSASGAGAAGAADDNGTPTAAASGNGGAPRAADADGGGAHTLAIGAGAAADGGKDAHVVTVDESKAGTTVDLAHGQKLVVMLKANPTTGFDWTVSKSPPALGKPEMGSIAGAGEGGSGLRRLTFAPKEALPPGEHDVELGYQRGFEEGKAPLKTFRFKVRAAK